MGLMHSWVASANDPGSDFPLNNLPCGVFSVGSDDAHCGVAIGEMILDVCTLEKSGILKLADRPVFSAPSWNDLMALDPKSWALLRQRLIALLGVGSSEQARIEPHLVRMDGVRLLMPFEVAGFTDFFSGRHHATNVGTLSRNAETALPPNWLHMPIAYNGRASSIVVSGTDFHRPWGQLKGSRHPAPVFAPSRRFDIELELGAVVGQGSAFGQPITVAEADEMIFGYVLLNDWSARDIQGWEYQPLGPFHAKSTATTISPWIVTKAALEPFRIASPPRDVPLLPYLQEPGPMLYDIALEIGLAPENRTETVISRTNSSQLYYSAAQQLAHHTTSGCQMRVGDILGSGTISGPESASRGSLLELSWAGQQPIVLADGSTRSFLEDGDTITLRGAALGKDYRIGFGPCMGKVLPPLQDPYAR